MHGPIFIIGNPRSGTTLLRLMLTNHKDIVIPPECGFMLWLYDAYQAATFNPVTIRNFVNDLQKAKKIETWNLDYSKLRTYLLEAKPTSYAFMAGLVYEFYGHTLERDFLRWGDKNNYYLHHIKKIFDLYPSAQFVHIVRDGRDVACSYRALKKSESKSIYFPQLPHNIAKIAAEWRDNIQQIRNSFSKIGWQHVYETRYEDLVSQPQEELEKVCNFLKLPYDPAMENYYFRNQLDHQEPEEFLQWKAKTIQPATTSEIGKYKRELTLQEIREFETISAYALKAYNYAQ